MYSAYVLTDDSKEQLLQKFTPVYDVEYAHHITIEFGVPKNTPVPLTADIKVIGHIDNGEGIEALVVTVDGNRYRNDGKQFHITLSLDSTSNYTPKDSNELICDNPSIITYLDEPITLTTVPSVLH